MTGGYEDLIGKPAPAFTLPNHDGQPFEYRAGTSGLPTALVFYPESGSFLCTQELVTFRDSIIEKPHFNPEKTHVIAISPQSIETQRQFVEHENFNFPVLSDAEGVAARAYDIGRGFFGLTALARVTFVVDKKGIIRDALDTTLNFTAHQKFVDKWLHKLEDES
ncbi:AhpC-TSA-domain-containing protein [Coprinellus micaceus]|uniref:thioredoxin-dependent peroxiredoxin n=1 Tax=Coprinellus micaceus TaxID=71717 RepID=A0A4Y7U0N4_COPMI|nr:AhpC-TSA-domain-containing protein [Coprinellus micaceus]